jgi:prevent-host-death family protein
MVTTGHLLVMKQVGIAELKARLSSHLRSVRRGHPITVVDRGTPVATLTGVESQEQLRARHPIRTIQSVQLPPRVKRPVDSLAALREERKDR